MADNGPTWVLSFTSDFWIHCRYVPDLLRVEVCANALNSRSPCLDHLKNRRTSLLIGLVSFVGATVILWLAHQVAWVCTGRFLQGMASAAVWSVGLALLTDTLSQERVPVAMGYVSVGFSAGTIVGPIIGGMLYTLAGFHGVMGLSVGLLGLDILLRLLLVEKPAQVEVAEVEEPASACDASEHTSLLGRRHPRPLSIGSDPGAKWHARSGSTVTPEDIQSFIDGNTGGQSPDRWRNSSNKRFSWPRQDEHRESGYASIASVLNEGADASGGTPSGGNACAQGADQGPQESADEPQSSGTSLEPAYWSLLRSPRFTATLVCAFAQAVTMAAFESTLPVHLREVAGFSAFDTSLVFIPLMVPAVLAPVVGKMPLYLIFSPTGV